MSRLTTHKQKQNIKKMLALSVLTIGLISFVFMVGLPLLANSVSYLNRFVQVEKDSTSTTDDSFIGTLNINSVPVATNSAEIYISGSVRGYDTLEFYINNTKVDETAATNTFNHRIGSLKNGENIIVVKAVTDNNKHEKLSDEIIVAYNHKPLELDIETPQSGQEVHNEEIQLIGITNAGASVSVNNTPVVVNFEGKFSTFIKLKEGENDIRVKASDRAGNTKEAEITVNYDPED